MRILLAEDEKALSKALVKIFEKNNYSIDAVYDGEEALDYLDGGNYDAAVLDIMMPKVDGITVLKKLRESGSNLPVLMLTAKSEIDDKVLGLDSGANYYLTKPFDTGELLARIRARLRRTEENLQKDLSFADIHLEQATFRLCGRERSIKLPRKEYQLLEYLIINHGQILPRETIITKIWGYDEETEYNQLDVYISFVRKKLKFVESRAVIVTTKGIGYSLEEGE